MSRRRSNRPKPGWNRRRRSSVRPSACLQQQGVGLFQVMADRQQLIDPMAAGVAGLDGFITAAGERRGQVQIVENVAKMLHHFGTVTSDQIIVARPEQSFDVVPWRTD